MCHACDVLMSCALLPQVGMTADQIAKYEDLGYVMSGSRHSRMNAIRIRKENQVCPAPWCLTCSTLGLCQPCAMQSGLLELMAVAAHINRSVHSSGAYTACLQVYTAEEKAALAMYNFEENKKKEEKIIGDMQQLVQNTLGGSDDESE